MQSSSEIVSISKPTPNFFTGRMPFLLSTEQCQSIAELKGEREVNWLPQGSVLSPTLFHLYTNDLPVTGSRKFIYADDICLTEQAQRYAELECCLSSDMVRMASYCRLRRLKPSPMKTVTSVFHLLNTSAARELIMREPRNICFTSRVQKV